MKIVEIPSNRFSDLKEIFLNVFDSDPPRPRHSRIFACFNEDGKPVGFIHAESVVLLGQIFVVPDERDKTVSIVKNMLQFVRRNFDGKVNVAAVASEPRFKKMFDSYGMVSIEGTFHRKNADF